MTIHTVIITLGNYIKRVVILLWDFIIVWQNEKYDHYSDKHTRP